MADLYTSVAFSDCSLAADDVEVPGFEYLIHSHQLHGVLSTAERVVMKRQDIGELVVQPDVTAIL